MQQNSGESMSQVEMQQCIQDCLNCHAVCMQVADKYRQGGSEQANAEHMYMLLDCAEMCLTSAHFMQHNSPLYGYTCQTCAQVCTHCANMCEQMGNSDCVNACRACAESCQQITKLVA